MAISIAETSIRSVPASLTRLSQRRPVLLKIHTVQCTNSTIETSRISDLWHQLIRHWWMTLLMTTYLIRIAWHNYLWHDWSITGTQEHRNSHNVSINRPPRTHGSWNIGILVARLMALGVRRTEEISACMRARDACHVTDENRLKIPGTRAGTYLYPPQPHPKIHLSWQLIHQYLLFDQSRRSACVRPSAPLTYF